MPSLQLTIAAQHPEVISGESLEVQVTLENKGSSAVELHRPEDPSELEFILRSEGGRAQVLSGHAKRMNTAEPPPPLPALKAPLAPAAKFTYDVDIAGYSITPLPVGQYQLSVAYGSGAERVGSANVPVAIVSPRIGALASAVSPAEERLGIVFAHSERGGGCAVFQRESAQGMPYEGVAFRRVDVAPPLSVAGVASSASSEPSDGVRWYAWLLGDSVGAGVTQGKTQFERIDPVLLGLRSPALYEVGMHPNAESASFVAMGTDAQNHIALAIATFQATGTASVKTVPLANQTMPARWAVQYHPHDAVGRLDVVTVTVDGGTVRVQSQSVSPATGKADQPIQLIESRDRLAALGLGPIAPDGNGVVDVVFDPVGDHPQMTFLRLPLQGGQPLAKWTFPAPEDEKKNHPAAWAIARAQMNDPFVLAKLGDKLMARRVLNGSNWAVVADGAAQAANLHLEAIGDAGVWAIWTFP